MLSDWYSRIKSALSPRVPSTVVSEELAQAMRCRSASSVRLVLKELMGIAASVPLPQLLTLAGSLGWSDVETAKLAAYCDFYSGRVAAAYQRVVESRLAEDDFELAMTALMYCQMHDRFEEGYRLISGLDTKRFAGHDDYGDFLIICALVSLWGGDSLSNVVAYFDRVQQIRSFSNWDFLASNAYAIYFEAGDLDGVERMLRMSSGRPLSPEMIYSMAYVELARDYYPEGFRLAESRYDLVGVRKAMNPSLLAKPRWQGESLAGKRLLVHGEQGFGDVVMMARYLPRLAQAAEGATIIVDWRDIAIPLLQRNFPECEIAVSDPELPISVPFDYWVGIMSLPFLFDTTADSVPLTAGYLEVPPDSSAYWQDRIKKLVAPKTVKIGLAWSGNPRHRADRRRSIPFDLIVPYLAGVSDCSFVALQTSVPDDVPANLIGLAGELVTLADTAALIAEVDLVITVDTSIVHLAGALGKRTWLLLPFRYEWRWGLQGERNAWYDSVSVIRQTGFGDWHGVLSEVFERRLPRFVQAQLAAVNDDLA